MQTLFAYTFKSDLVLADMFRRLNSLGPWEWVMRDSERWGDYISTRALRDPDYAMVKLIVETGYFAINVNFDSDLPNAQTKCDELQEALLTKVLPLIGAHNIQPTDTYD